jgi:beta-galactosidase/beta-glucuronidase
MEFSSADPYFNTRIQVPFSYDFKGKAVCSRNFDAGLENIDSWNYVLYCDGINYQCEISINGRFVEKHEGGFTPFSTIIQDGIIREHDNSIEIKIDNTLDYSKTLPLRNTANYPKNYGGIYRDIYILAVPKVFIRNINLYTEIDINFNADITNKITITSTDISDIPALLEGKKYSVKTEIIDTAGEVKASSPAVEFTESQNSTIEIENKLTLSNPVWSPQDPHLYKILVTVYLGTDTFDSYQTVSECMNL